jgi:hypothetical protein
MDISINSELRDKFLEFYKIAQNEYNFSSPIFIRMLNDHGALETARRLSNTATWQNGFDRMAKLGRADLTVEHIILQDKYRKYFTDIQLRNAQAKIDYANHLYGKNQTL